MRESEDRPHRRIAVVAEAFLDRTLPELLAWLTEAAPEVSAVELGSGGYAPHPHCDRALLLRSQDARRDLAQELDRGGFQIAALNAWGNPLHSDPRIAARHDRDLRETIRLAAPIGVDRVIALAGCPAAHRHDRVPHFAAGGWLPYLEGVYEEQWERRVAPYWSSISEFARIADPELRVCVELHPGTAVYNVETFNRLAALGDNLAANVDPSHFFWQRMDTEAIMRTLGDRVAHVHAKDVVFNPEVLGLQGLLDHRWPGPTAKVPWKFASVGDGHDADWWARFAALTESTAVRAIAIEHEDPDVAPEIGVPAAARLLSSSVEVAA
ncbi:MAG: sugar phosphate isomerase/epimerase [Solirubrobacteraceae bacterium]